MQETVEKAQEAQKPAKFDEATFKAVLDQVVTKGINECGPAFVYAQLCLMKQFTEVVYDNSVMDTLARMRQQQVIAAEAARQLAEQQGTK